MYIYYKTLLIPGWVYIITANEIPWDGFNSGKRDNARQKSATMLHKD